MNSKGVWRRCSRALPLVAAATVLLVGLLTALPTFMVDLGLPGEGDAVDYRVPLLRWMLRHHRYPVWDWTVVDDYPMLGELLMLPLYAARPALARLVPLASYLATLLAAGALAAHPHGLRRGRRRALVAAGWVAALYPLAFPSTLLMTDALGTLGVVLALLGVVRGQRPLSTLGMALAVASKYWTWPLVLPLLAAAAVAQVGRDRARTAAAIALGALAGALPTLLRNVVVNGGNPFYPLLLGLFGQEQIQLAIHHDRYGTGTDLLALLRLPYDLLVRSNVEDLYDYNLGVAFYLQLAAAGLAVFWRRRVRRHACRRLRARAGLALAVFGFGHLLCWFYGAQQVRFLAPALLVTSLGLLGLARRGLPPWLLGLVLLAGSYTFRVAHWGDWELARGQRASAFAPALGRALPCLETLPPSAELGLARRDGFLGFVDVDFVFVAPHPYAVQPLSGPPPAPEYLYDPLREQAPAGYLPWPPEVPCLWRRAPTPSSPPPALLDTTGEGRERTDR